ncbi:hypothetical protein GF354_00320 [Candidatus Peregrinibacteria bacterium]|nr:hypothetical protein [Candidatus Peregrinibacteria bacterium]
MSLRRRFESFARVFVLGAALSTPACSNVLGCDEEKSEAEIQAEQKTAMQDYLWKQAQWEVEKQSCLIKKTAEAVRKDADAVLDKSIIVDECNEEVGPFSPSPEFGKVTCTVELYK